MFGLSASQLPILALAAGLAAALAVLVHARPRFGVAMWLATIGFVPVWFGVNFVYFFLPASLVGIGVLVAVAPGMPRRLVASDLLIAFFFVSCLAPILTGGSTATTVFVALSQWLLAYLLGRMLPASVGLEWIYGCIAVIFLIVSIGTIVESITDTNIFNSWGPKNGLYERWGGIRSRSDLSRAEWAFGNSIAVGASLALAIPLTLASRFRLWIRVAMAMTMLGAVIVTISRVSMICASLAILISVVSLRERIPRTARIAVIIVFSVFSLALAPFVLGIFESAGDEATLSADYRSDLTSLIPSLAILGFSPVAYRSPTGELYFASFQSIDSQLILTGLTYGWFALIWSLVLILGALVLVVRGRASPPVIALAAQLPALATVALITQYTMFFWFVAGLAVFSHAVPPSEAGDAARPESAGPASDSGEARHRSSPYETGRISGPALG